MTNLKKMQNVIDAIQKTEVKKQGKNTFSNYDYFTPEQISSICSQECSKENLLYKFDLLRNDLGIIGRLSIYDLEQPKDEPLVYEMASDIPIIKATNVAQQLGGAMTYTKRYLLMNAFDITDNNLDFNTSENTKKHEELKIEWLTNEQFEAALNCGDVKGIAATLEKYSTATHKMKRDFKTELEMKLNELI